MPLVTRYRKAKAPLSAYCPALTALTKTAPRPRPVLAARGHQAVVRGLRRPGRAADLVRSGYPGGRVHLVHAAAAEGLRRRSATAPRTAGPGSPIAPRLLWQLDTAGWTILGFEHLHGRPANLAPGSADLPKIADALWRLGDIEVPDLPLRRFEDRWAGLVDDAALHLLSGKHLLHTDLNPHNILIAERAHIVDWAWPTLGAAWVDPVCAALWLIAEGHTPPAASGSPPTS
jgi:hypothetical protein